MVQPEFVEALMLAEGISMEEGEEEDNRMEYWAWLDEDETTQQSNIARVREKNVGGGDR